MKTAGSVVVFGAGNIGRSFIGQLFARAGSEVVFVDVDAALVAELNARRGYSVIVKRQGRPDEEIPVRGVRAVDGRNIQAVALELSRASLAACCVGKAALPKILPALASGLELRAAAGGLPLDLILAENDREAADTVRAGLSALLPPDFPLRERLGLVGTSIGKMVPLMRAEDLARDRLRVFAEEYNTLIVDRRGFLGTVPEIPGIEPVEAIQAYVDRKLFVHNLGHAAVAYFGYRADPDCALIARALMLPGVEAAARRAMREAADALAAEYPGALTPRSLADHIEDLILRFGNEALGDTIHRVGRDLGRKLDKSDRILGAALLCEKHGLPWNDIAGVFAAALDFRAPDESGSAFPADAELGDFAEKNGLEALLSLRCRLDLRNPRDSAVVSGILAAAGRP